MRSHVCGVLEASLNKNGTETKLTVQRTVIPAEIAPIILTLEAQLSHLDRIGAFIAAAHIDAAINKLRVDYMPGEEGSKPPKPPHQ